MAVWQLLLAIRPVLRREPERLQPGLAPGLVQQLVQRQQGLEVGRGKRSRLQNQQRKSCRSGKG